MPLEILAPFVVIAVLVIMLVVSRSGLSRRATLRSEDDVRARLAIDFPDFEGEAVLIDDSRTTALLPGPDRVGLVRAFGDRSTTRMLTAGAVRAVAESEKGVVIEMTDFTWPRQSVALKSPADRARWRQALAPLQAAPTAEERPA